MARPRSQCSYEFDRDAWCEANGPDPAALADCPHAAPDGWRCSHPVHGTEDRCVFHLDPAERRALGITAAEVNDALIDALADGDDASRNGFVGAVLDGLDLIHRRFDGASNEPIDLRHAEIRGAFRLEGTVTRTSFRLQYADVNGLRIDDVKFDAVSYFNHAVFRDDVTIAEQVDDRLKFDDARFEGNLVVEPVTFVRGVRFNRCEFDGDVRFYADFDNEAQFVGATFNGEVDVFADFNADFYFEDATFNGPASFFGVFHGTMWASGVTFADDVRIHGRFYAEALLDDATFRGDVSFDRLDSDVSASRFYEFVDFGGADFLGTTGFENVDFRGDADFRGATFGSDATFDAAVFRGRTDLTDVTYRGALSVRDVVFDDRVRFGLDCRADRTVVDAAGASLAAGVLDLRRDATIVYDLTRATLGSVELRAAPGERSFDNLRLYETDFDGFDFSRHRAELARNGWTIHETGVGEAREDAIAGLEATYLKAKNGANAVAENRAASAFFGKEMVYRRRRHRRELREAPPASRAFLGSAGRYVSNLVMDLTCGYGERPRRVVGSSLGVVVAFGLLYYALGVGGDSLLQNLVFSTESFVTLVLGSPDLSTPYANLLTSAEAFLGAYFIALFVFALTRSVRR